MTEQIFEYAKKQGLNIALVIFAIWSNARMNDMESRLYHCYETMQLSEIDPYDKDYNYRLKQVAILPISKEDEKRYKGVAI